MKIIDELIDFSKDNANLVVDTIGQLLRIESDEQQKRAKDLGQDSDLYKFSVFVDRENPLEANKNDCTPVVVVNIGKTKINKVSNGSINKTLHLEIDCYGFGSSQGVDGKITTGDFNAIRSCRRLVYLVTQILTAEINKNIQLNLKDQFRDFHIIDQKFTGAKLIGGSNIVFSVCRLTFEGVVINDIIENNGVPLDSINVKIDSQGEVIVNVTYDYDEN